MTDKRFVTPEPWNSDRLKEWRLRMGMTKGQAAKALGLSLNGYGAYERGYVQVSISGKAPYFGHGMAAHDRPIPKHVALACLAIESVGLERSENLRKWLAKA